MFFREVGGDVGDDAGPEFVYDRGEGNRSVVVKDGGVCFLVYEDGLAVHPGFGGVSLLSHALEEEGESRVEDGGHGFEQFSGDSVGSRGFASRHSFEALVIACGVDLSIEHGLGEWGGWGKVISPGEWRVGVDRGGLGEGGCSLFGKALDDFLGVSDQVAIVIFDGGEGCLGIVRAGSSTSFQESDD